MKDRACNNSPTQKDISHFDLLPAEITDQIISYLPVDAGRHLSSVNSSLRKKMLGDGMNSNCFFAVGKPINLYRDSYYTLLSLSGEQNDFLGKKTMRTHFSADEVWDSLQHESYTVALFSDLKAASLYQYYHSPEYYCRQYDVLITTEAPAIFVISLKNSYLIRHQVTKLTEYWYDYIPYAPHKHPQEMLCMQTPESNIRHLHWARMSIASNKHLFWSGRNMTAQSAYPAYFDDIWDASFNVRATNRETLCLQAVTAIFNSYSDSFFANLMRHHHKEVSSILTFLGSETHLTMKALHEHIAKCHTNAKNDPMVNQSGLYIKMLDFISRKISEFNDVNQVEGVNAYFTASKRE